MKIFFHLQTQNITYAQIQKLTPEAYITPLVVVRFQFSTEILHWRHLAQGAYQISKVLAGPTKGKGVQETPSKSSMSQLHLGLPDLKPSSCPNLKRPQLGPNMRDKRCRAPLGNRYSSQSQHKLKMLWNGHPQRGAKKALQNDISTTWFTTTTPDAIFHPTWSIKGDAMNL